MAYDMARPFSFNPVDPDTTPKTAMTNTWREFPDNLLDEHDQVRMPGTIRHWKAHSSRGPNYTTTVGNVQLGP